LLLHAQTISCEQSTCYRFVIVGFIQTIFCITTTLFEKQDGVRVFVGRFRTAIIMLQLDELQLIFTSYHSQLICPLAVIVINRYRCKKSEKI